jgi:ribosomal-protein-alanine N-acetyltransferase
MNDSVYFYEFPVLAAKRLILRQITFDDVSSLFDIYSSEEVTKYYGIFAITDIQQIYNLISSFNKGFDNSTSIRWGIELRETKEIIGTCGFHNWHKGFSRAEIGYEINKKYWGRGYAAEAINAMAYFGFNYMKLNRIEALTYPENEASAKVLAKNGFKQEGILREYAYFREKYQDLVMHSLLKKDRN